MTRAQWVQIIRDAARKANRPREPEHVTTLDGVHVVGTIVRLSWSDLPANGYEWTPRDGPLRLTYRVSSVRKLIPLVMAEVKRRYGNYYPRRGRHSWGEA